MSDAKIPNIDYTRLLTCILYEGGAADVLEELYKRGIKEGYFVSVRGAPLGRSSTVQGLPEIPQTEILHVVVAADQADYIFQMIYEFAKLDQPQKGIIFVKKLTRSSPNILPEDTDLSEMGFQQEDAA
mgnify:FL=1